MLLFTSLIHSGFDVATYLVAPFPYMFVLVSIVVDFHGVSCLSLFLLNLCSCRVLLASSVYACCDNACMMQP